MLPPRPPGFETRYRVRFDEAGADGLARASSLLRFAQDVAWQHGAALGLTREWYEEQQLVWLVRAVELTLVDPVPVGAELHARTAVIGHRRVWARRQVEFRLTGVPNDDGPAVLAETDWVLVGGGGRIMRIPAAFGTLFGVPEQPLEMHRVPVVPAPEPAPDPLRLVVRTAEVDPNGHLNNAVHLDWFDEAIGAAGGGADLRHFPRRYGVEYLHALQVGAAAQVTAWRADAGPGDGWHGAITAEGGVAAGRARLTFGSSVAHGSAQS